MSDIKLTRDQRQWLALVEKRPRECDAFASVAMDVERRGLTHAVAVAGEERRRIHSILSAGREWLTAYRSKR